MKNYKELQDEINKLPSGSITKKNIKGKDYYYYRYYQGNKRKEKYIPFSELEKIKSQILRRKELEKQRYDYLAELYNNTLDEVNNMVNDSGFLYTTDEEKDNSDVKNEIIKFVDNDLQLDVRVSSDREDIWLSLDQISQLFDRDKSVISRHIKNIFDDGELEKIATVANFATVQKEGYRNVERNIDYYNLDLILTVGYRVNSKRGIAFRKWATSILKDYMLKGYAVNQRRLDILNKTIEIQSRTLASSLEIDSDDVLNVINEYTKALDLLDEYDHQVVKKPKGNDSIYELTYEECRSLIDSMKFSQSSSVFGVEKEKGKLNGILAAIYQNVFGQELYPSIEEKAANLLYFLIKDHPFADGCKRIAATIFLEFLNKNKYLIVDGKQTISNSSLVAITLMFAESKPEEKEIMVRLVMNFLNI